MHLHTSDRRFFNLDQCNYYYSACIKMFFKNATNVSTHIARNTNISTAAYIFGLDHSHGKCVDDKEKFEFIYNFVMIGVPSACIIVGTIGNAVVYCVFNQRVYRNNIMASVLRYLSCLDIAILWTVLSQFIFIPLGVNSEDGPPTICFLALLWSQAMVATSNWVLVVITLTRLIHLKFPLSVRTICSKFNYYIMFSLAHVYVWGVFGGTIATIVHQIPAKIYYSGISCYQMMIMPSTMSRFAELLIFATSFVIPATALVIFNTLIILEVRAVERQHQRLFATGPAHRAEETTTMELSGAVLNKTKNYNYSQNALQMKEFEESRAPRILKHGDFVPQNIVESKNTRTEKFLHSHLEKNRSRRSGGHKYRGINVIKNRKPERRPPAASANNTFEVKDDDDSSYCCTESADICNNAAPASPDAGKSLRSKRGWSYFSIRSASPAAGSSVDAHTPVTPPRNLPTFGALSIEMSTSSLTFPSRVASATSWYMRLSTALSNPVDMDVELEEEPGKATTGWAQRDARWLPGTSAAAADAADAKSTNLQAAEERKRSSRVQGLTHLLMASSGMFIFLNIPYWLFSLKYSEPMYHDPAVGCYYRDMVKNCVELFRYASHSLNFFFYCAVGGRFRQEFIAWIRSINS